MVFIDDILKDSFLKTIDDWKEDGLSDAEITTRIERFNFEPAFRAVIDKYSDDLLDITEKSKFDVIREHRLGSEEFVIHQEQKWGECFSYSELLNISVIELSEQYLKYINTHINDDEKRKKEFTFASIHCLHARACQIHSEIICLCRNGYPDAALARWRTMYELCCYAEFIRDNGEEVAKAYYNNKSGKNKWAKKADCFKDKKRITITDIRDKCDFTKNGWEDNYKLACFAVHANSNGTSNRMGMIPGKPIPIDRVDVGVAFPATRAAFTLRIITSIFFNLFRSADSVAYSFFINRMVDKLYNLYLDTDKRVFPDLYKE